MLSEQEIVWYRSRIRKTMMLQTNPDYTFHDPLNMADKMNSLATTDREAFLDLCQRLLRDQDQAVRHGLLQVLSEYTQKDRELAQILMEQALGEEVLINAALFVLSRIGTREALPTLGYYAKNGRAWALGGVDRLVRTEREVQVAVRLARQYLLSPEYRMREIALDLLRHHSTIEQEQDLILEAIRLYKDEVFIAELEDAEPAKVLPALKKLASEVKRNSTAFDDLSRTITILEEKARKRGNEEVSAASSMETVSSAIPTWQGDSI
jgi:hypothetical protein